MTSIGSLIIFGLNGLYYASIIFFMIIGLSLVFDTLHMVNLAHGVFLGFGAYVGIEVIDFLMVLTGVPWIAIAGLLILPALLVGIFAAILDVTVYKPLYKMEETFQVLATFGVLFILYDVIVFHWTARPLSPNELQVSHYLGRIDLYGFTYQIFFIIAIAVFAVGALLAVYIMERTTIGKTAQAMSEDREMVRMIGINEKRVRIFLFSFAGLYAAVGGALLVPISTATPELLIDYIILAFAGMVIGGVGSIRGAIIAALVIGLVRGYGIVYIPAFETAIIFVMMIAVIMVKPEGLFGKEVDA